MADNIYVIYVVVMLGIAIFAAGAIAGINYLLSVLKNFINGDGRYRRRVLLVVAIIGTVALSVIVHWLATPPE